MADQNTYVSEMAHWQAKLSVDTRWQLNRRRHQIIREWRLRDRASAKNSFWGAMLRPVATYAVALSLVAVSLTISFSATEFSDGEANPLGTNPTMAAAECKTCAIFNGCYL